VLSWDQIFATVTEPYERKARLYPALLALLPILGIAVGLYGMGGNVKQSLGALVTTFGGVYLLVNIGRERGKRMEPHLFRLWRGTPTTQLQRHRDDRIDRITKRARHIFLAGKLGVSAPSAAAEAADPQGADEFYAAGTRWLIEHTRDTKRFPLIFAENVSYGYRRNALGLKPIALTVSIFSLLWVLVSQDVLTRHGIAVIATTGITPGAKLSLAVSLTALAVWILFFTKETVRTAAFAYADMLLRACSVL
jgi:hypothetical protein